MGDNLGSTQITIPMEVTPPHIETPKSEILPSEGDNIGSTRITTPMEVTPPHIETPELETSQSESTESSNGGLLARKICETVLLIVLLPILFIIILPFSLLCAFVVYFICNVDTIVNPDFGRQPEVQGIYQKVQKFGGTAVQIAKLASVIHNRIMILLLMWLIINVSVRSLRRKIVLGSELWKWSLLIVILSCGYLVISAVVRILLHYITKLHIDKKNVAYLARGLRKSINLIIFSILVLLTWHFYFCSHQGLRETRNTEVIFRVMKWTSTFLLILSLCWLVKTLLLLIWEADAIYNRFRDRILVAAFQCYFLCGCFGGPVDIFKPKNIGKFKKNRHGESRQEPEKTDQPENDSGAETKPTTKKTNGEREKKEKEKEEEERKLRDIEQVMRKEQRTTYDIKRMAKFLTNIAKLSSRDEDDDTSEILELLRGNFPLHDGFIYKKDLSKSKLEEHDIELLYGMLQEGNQKAGNQSDRVPFETFKKWMERAYKYCLALGYTLIDAKEVVNCLDKLMTGIVIIAVIILEALLTEIATLTKVVLLVSPLLGAAVIFSKSVHTLIEGVLFTFVMHPFIVGDQCIIDGVKMEVKQMGILSTTFLKIDSGEESIYPNSVLVTKPIDNVKYQLAPSMRYSRYYG